MTVRVNIQYMTRYSLVETLSNFILYYMNKSAKSFMENFNLRNLS